MKEIIFLKSGDAPDLGGFARGEIRQDRIGALRLAVHVKRGTVKEVSQLTMDECRRFFFEMNVNDLPDNIKAGDLQELLILTREAVNLGLDIPKKVNLKKIKELLNLGDMLPENIEEEVKKDG